MATAKTSLFPLPDSQIVETLYVRLSDGRVVPRTPDEVLDLQVSGEQITVIGPAAP